jgi:hypothetical protein
MAHYDPETGYPTAPDSTVAEPFNPEDTFTFTDGRTVTGADVNETLRRYFEENPRGQQLLRASRGEDVEPPALLGVLEDETTGERSLQLGNSGEVITDTENLTGSLLLHMLELPEE